LMLLIEKIHGADRGLRFDGPGGGLQQSMIRDNDRIFFILQAA
jgi:hypothetical protein